MTDQPTCARCGGSKHFFNDDYSAHVTEDYCIRELRAKWSEHESNLDSAFDEIRELRATVDAHAENAEAAYIHLRTRIEKLEALYRRSQHD